MISRNFVDFTVFQLLNNNVHIGSLVKFTLLTSYWFIFGVRNNFSIINLSVTFFYLRRTLYFLDLIISCQGHVLFVDQDFFFNQIDRLIKNCGEQFVLNSWIFGTLTNFKKLFWTYNKIINLKVLNSKQRKMIKSLRGVYLFPMIPSLVVTLNLHKNKIAIKECMSLDIPVINLIDSDSLLEYSMYSIPANDDSPISKFFLVSLFLKSILISKLELLIKLKKYKQYKKLNI